jgi:serine/threonine-protein kinase HipA
MPELSVHLYGEVIGHLVGDSWRDFDFVASDSGIQRFGLGSTVLSESVPLLAQQPRGKAARRRNFFEELLPEGVIRQRLVDRVRVAPTDTLSLLAAYGRDVAGAVQVLDSSTGESAELARVRLLSEVEVAELLNDVADFPLGNVPDFGKASLAGVQEKVLLARVEGRWGLCLNGYASTHIVKPVSRAFPDMIFNEEYGLRLARAVGLVNYETWIETFDGVDALVIERYDRDGSLPGGRLHQEDMNQVLGASGSEKYQERGGKVSFLRIADVLRRVQGVAGFESLLEHVTLAAAIGNLDLHTKNLSLLHSPDDSALLAPAYDVVPLAHYPNVDGRMALAINGVYEHAQLKRGDLVAEAEMWGMDRDAAEARVENCLLAIRAAAAQQVPHPRAYPRLVESILGGPVLGDLGE